MIEDVGDIDGVVDVAVDLPTGAVTVTADRPPTDAQIQAAVDQAGYQVAGQLGHHHQVQPLHHGRNTT